MFKAETVPRFRIQPSSKAYSIISNKGRSGIAQKHPTFVIKGMINNIQMTFAILTAFRSKENVKNSGI